VHVLHARVVHAVEQSSAPLVDVGADGIRLLAHLVVLLNCGTGAAARDGQAITTRRVVQVERVSDHAAASAGEAEVVAEQAEAAEGPVVVAHLLVNLTDQPAGTEKTLQARPRIIAHVEEVGLEVWICSRGWRSCHVCRAEGRNNFSAVAVAVLKHDSRALKHLRELVQPSSSCLPQRAGAHGCHTQGAGAAACAAAVGRYRRHGGGDVTGSKQSDGDDCCGCLCCGGGYAATTRVA